MVEARHVVEPHRRPSPRACKSCVEVSRYRPQPELWPERPRLLWLPTVRSTPLTRRSKLHEFSLTLIAWDTARDQPRAAGCGPWYAVTVECRRVASPQHRYWPAVGAERTGPSRQIGPSSGQFSHWRQCVPDRSAIPGSVIGPGRWFTAATLKSIDSIRSSVLATSASYCETAMPQRSLRSQDEHCRGRERLGQPVALRDSSVVSCLCRVLHRLGIQTVCVRRDCAVDMKLQRIQGLKWSRSQQARSMSQVEQQISASAVAIVGGWNPMQAMRTRTAALSQPISHIQ